MDKLGVYFPPVNSKSFFQHYLPGIGAVSHAAFALHVINPAVVSRVTSGHDLLVGNVLFASTNIGMAFYLYHRSHMKKVASSARVIYSIYGALLFNLGSTLFWAITKLVLPDHLAIRGTFGVATSVILVQVAREYFGYIDTLLPDD